MTGFLNLHSRRLSTAVLCAWSIVIVAAAARGQTPPPPKGQLIDVGGYRLHLYCTGSGSPTTVIAGAGYSFDWDPVQTEASKGGRVCSYDPAGSAWSDPSPETPTCDRQVAELHRLLHAGGVRGPVVLVGQSIGAVFARLYAAHYPSQVVGMVIVDHAAVIRAVGPPVGPSGALPPGVILGKGVTLPPNAKGAAGEPRSPYQALPASDRALHEWADALPSPVPPRAQRALFDRCWAEADSIQANDEHSLKAMPLAVISLPIADPGYKQLQTRLLQMSSRSVQLIADSSGHLVHVDRPDLVANAIARVRKAARDHERVGAEYLQSWRRSI